MSIIIIFKVHMHCIQSLHTQKIVILSGAGVSAESGIPTIRSSDGLWQIFSWTKLASIDAWLPDPAALLDFFNYIRELIAPNEANLSLKRLEDRYEVFIITQNIDNLHEKVGSQTVIYVHSEIDYAHSEHNATVRLKLNGKPLFIGNLASGHHQLRPDVVLFGEDMHNLELCQRYMPPADKVLVIGTSLSVYPINIPLKLSPKNSKKSSFIYILKNDITDFNLFKTEQA
ncbi:MULTISPECIES: SIR2 family NAD-dependent protein deacylase [Edwardsiella]|uniref:SIR2 family NAD-dependent protein deacylase n=2 Tax=Hafniaceae TaxID=1903412 RepID=UPI0009072508|nr:Sir2 family NAD-dependent protein deacetylase [Edwardsiella anguillarum]